MRPALPVATPRAVAKPEIVAADEREALAQLVDQQRVALERLPPIDLVVVNLYPFAETLVGMADDRENHEIGQSVPPVRTSTKRRRNGSDLKPISHERSGPLCSVPFPSHPAR